MNATARAVARAAALQGRSGRAPATLRARCGRAPGVQAAYCVLLALLALLALLKIDASLDSAVMP